MKKTLSILILTAIVAVGCCSAKKTAEGSSASTEKKGQDLEFDYTALTRGSFKKITATQAGLTFTDGRGAKPQTVAISTKDWNSMVNFYEKNLQKNLDGLKDIEVPSKKHQYDGALAATLTIRAGKTYYATPTFDHGTPPAEVKGLVNEMIKLAGVEIQK